MSEGIHIKKKNRGKFTATKKRTGKSTEELTHSKNPLTRKRAIFAQNARKWNHKKNKNESYMRTMRLSGNNLRRVVAESTMRILREARDPMSNINALIDQANEASDFDNLTPHMHDFLSSLYDLIVAYYDVLGKEDIANELENAAEGVRNGECEDDYEWGIIPDE